LTCKSANSLISELAEAERGMGSGQWRRLFEHRLECRRKLRRPYKAISGGPFQVSLNEGLCETKVSSTSPHDPF